MFNGGAKKGMAMFVSRNFSDIRYIISVMNKRDKNAIPSSNPSKIRVSLSLVG